MNLKVIRKLSDKQMRMQFVLAAVVFAVSSLLADRPTLASEAASSGYMPGTYGDFAMGFVPGPGTYVENDTMWVWGNAGTALLEGQLTLNLEQIIVVNLTKITHVTDWNVLGANFGFGMFLPLVYGDITGTISAGGPGLSASDDAFGIGDIFIVPALLSWNVGNFHILAIQGVVAPTGDYSLSNFMNIGRNYWSFDSNLAFTWLDPARGHEVSFNAGIRFNTTNEATNYRTGNEFHLDFTVAQHFSEALAVGLVGYYYRQVSGDSGTGATLGSFEGESLGLGPAVQWTTSIGQNPVALTAKWIHDIHTVNRFSNDYIFMEIKVPFIAGM